MDTPAKVSGHLGDEQLGSALEGSDLVIIPAGNSIVFNLSIPYEEAMNRDP